MFSDNLNHRPKKSTINSKVTNSFEGLFSSVKGEVDKVLKEENKFVDKIGGLSSKGVEKGVHPSSWSRHFRPGKGEELGEIIGKNDSKHKEVEEASSIKKTSNNSDLNIASIHKKSEKSVSSKVVTSSVVNSNSKTILSVKEINERNANLVSLFVFLNDKYIGLFSNDGLTRSKTASLIIKTLSGVIPKSTQKQSEVKVDGNLLEKVILSIQSYLESNGTEDDKSEVCRNDLMNMLVQAKYILMERLKVKEELVKAKSGNGVKRGRTYEAI